MKTFIIKRSKWARGCMNGDSMMLNYQGNKCCLGFFAMSNGAKPDTLRNQPGPRHVAEDHPKALKLRDRLSGLLLKRGGNNRLCRQIMILNDDCAVKEGDRETKLTKMFAKIGWKPKFVD